MYLTELPFVFLFAVAIYFNRFAEGSMKLYPLIITLGCVMVFILVFLFRFVSLSFEEVRTRGPFSTHDSALINKDKTLILTMYPHKKLRIALFGNDGQPPSFDGLCGEPSIDIFLFRARAVGGRRTVKSILSYYTVPEADIEAVLKNERFVAEYELITLTSEHREDIREIKIKFKETV